MARLRTPHHNIEACVFGKLARCGCEVLHSRRPGWTRGFVVLVGGMEVIFHNEILGGTLASHHGVLPDRIPNRTINNVSRFPLGGIHAYADIRIPLGSDQALAVKTIEEIASGMWGQFGAIILSQPAVGPVEAASGGRWHFLRVHFKIWPGQGSLIEITFRQQIISATRAFSPIYADWQVPMTYRAVTAAKNLKNAKPLEFALKASPARVEAVVAKIHPNEKTLFVPDASLRFEKRLQPPVITIGLQLVVDLTVCRN